MCFASNYVSPELWQLDLVLLSSFQVAFLLALCFLDTGVQGEPSCHEEGRHILISMCLLIPFLHQIEYNLHAVEEVNSLKPTLCNV